MAKRLRLLPESLTTQEIQQNPNYLGVVLNFKDQISTEKEGYSNIINITTSAPDPDFAQRLANTVAEVYREENIREKNKRVHEARLFIESQLKGVEEELGEAQEKVRAFREENNLISLDSQSNVLLSQLSAQEARYEALKKSREEVALVLHQLEQRQAVPEKTIAGLFADQASPIFARLNGQLVDLNLKKDTLLKSKHQEALIKEAEKIEEVSIVKPALRPAVPVNPPKTLMTGLVGMVMGLILGLVLAFLFETIDTSIGTIEDVEALLEVPVLGIIPYVEMEELREELVSNDPQEENEEVLKRRARLAVHFAPKSILAESYRTLRTNIQFINFEKDVRTLSFTSASTMEGKTSTALNLGIALAQAGKKVLLVESDLRRPMISRTMGIDRSPGLTDIILGNHEWHETVRTVADFIMGKMGMEEILLTPGLDNLNLIPSGHIPPNPSELINSQRMGEFISQAAMEYDLVLFDSSPVLMAADGAILGSKVDGVVLVYLVGKTSRGALRRAKIQLERVGTRVLGAVLNGLTPEISPDFQDLRYDVQYAYGAEKKPAPSKKKWLPIHRFR